jgi:hypothetical protein
MSALPSTSLGRSKKFDGGRTAETVSPTSGSRQFGVGRGLSKYHRSEQVA